MALRFGSSLVLVLLCAACNTGASPQGRAVPPAAKQRRTAVGRRAATFGAGPTTLPTAFRRTAKSEVVATITRYRQALIRRDADALARMVHPRYRDARTGRVIDAAMVLQTLRQTIGRVHHVRVTIGIERIAFRGPMRAQADVKVDAIFMFGTRNSRHVDRVRMILVRDRRGGTWRFVAGM